ncbi:MAG: BamA/TamA family outer membrane protein [Candidatus Gastranaerophilales bacterium]|nr:BamA/TamA family outer membrane protein [Candidatus Gastranaerophilales bacterium]
MTLFNRYTDGINLTGNLVKGKQLGTTDIEIEAHEKSPFHITALMDNAGRDSIGQYRGGLMLQHDSLFGIRDKLTLGAYATRYSVTPFADYNIPVNKKDGRIGFSFSSSNSKVGYGDYRMFNIKSRSQNYSIYFLQPIIRKSYMELSSITSLEYKQAATSFDGEDLYKDRIPSAKTGLSFRYDTKRGIWYLHQSVGYAAPLFQSDINYVKIEGSLLRLHDFGHGVVGQLRANYQVIPKDVVPYADQMTVGGVATVRGFSEGLLIGRSGYLVSGELLFPLAPRTRVDKKTNQVKTFIGSYLKGFVFVDHAMVFPYKAGGLGSEGYNKDDVLMSIGTGIRIQLPGDLFIRLSWGFPLMKNRYEDSSWGRFHIEMSLSPDFDALVKLRKPKNVEKI